MRNKTLGSPFKVRVWSFARAVARSALLVAMVVSSPLAQQPAAEVRARLADLEHRLRTVLAEDLRVFAPALVDGAERRFDDAKQAARRGSERAVVLELLESAEAGLQEAAAAARRVRELLPWAAAARRDVGRLRSLAPNLLVAEQRLAEAVRAVTEGPTENVVQLDQRAAAAYRQTVLAAVRREMLAPAQQTVAEIDAGADPAALRRARRELAEIGAELDAFEDQPFEIAILLPDLEERIKAARDRLFPQAHHTPPTVVRLGEFVLHVERYEKHSWDFATGQITAAAGTAWTSFSCQNPAVFIVRPPSWQPREFVVVNSVRDPVRELSVLDARRFNAVARPGSVLRLVLPPELRIDRPNWRTELAATLGIRDTLLPGVVSADPKGDVRLQFADLRIRVESDGTGTALAGIARYPAPVAVPTDLVLTRAGFRVHLDGWAITPSSSTATARLEFPPSIVDPQTCRPAELSFEGIDVHADCRMYAAKPALAFGPWIVGDTAIRVAGVGVVADFSSVDGRPGMPLDWQGVVLHSGQTVAASAPVTSNTGYLHAPYAFTEAMVTAAGFEGHLDLAKSFTFDTLRPFGYAVELPAGALELAGSRVQGGVFYGGRIGLPTEAVLDSSAARAYARYAQLDVQDDLDVYAPITFVPDLRWGQLTRVEPRLIAYEASRIDAGHFYLAGSFAPDYDPVAQGFTRPEDSGTDLSLESLGLEGATFLRPVELRVFTPDTPLESPGGPRLPLVFGLDQPSWLNVGAAGVHGCVVAEGHLGPPLGPSDHVQYVGRVPFTTSFAAHAGSNLAMFAFVDSAVYQSDARGRVWLGGPSNISLLFRGLVITSTAHIAGAEVVIDTAPVLDYWGLELVSNPNVVPAPGVGPPPPPNPQKAQALPPANLAPLGVMSVKSGQIFLTSAGLREKRHFAEPFYLHWGEILANGNWRELFFDYAAVGQAFDRIPYTAELIELSEFDIADATKKENAFLLTAGTCHFDFYGATRFRIHDYNDINKKALPYLGRRIELFPAPDGSRPAHPTISRKWSGEFGFLKYVVRYDELDQDGFIGDGIVELDWIVGDSLLSKIDISAERICMSIPKPPGAGMEPHAFKCAFVGEFGKITKITGCACIEEGELRRMVLSAELVATAGDAVIKSAAYGWLEYRLTPEISQTEVHGNLSLNLSVFDVELDGLARFTFGREDAFIQGEILGRINASGVVPNLGLEADGRLEWYFSASAQQYLQGRLAVEVMASVGQASVEGGFFAGVATPKHKLWVLHEIDEKFDFSVDALPGTLSGVFAYVQAGAGFNIGIVSIGYEVHLGAGAFVGTQSFERDVLAAGGLAKSSDQEPSGFYIVGNLGIHVWGEILWGLLSASAYGNFAIIVPASFEGTLGLRACVLFVCGGVELHFVLATDGFFFNPL